MDFTLMRIYFLENKELLLQDLSYILFKVASKDKLYWKGHYGANFT